WSSWKLKFVSPADRRTAAGAALALLVATGAGLAAQSRPAAPPAAAAWLACAGGVQSRVVHPVRRLTALNDKALVDADVAKVFAQREKEQRVSAANLAKAR